MCKEFGRPVPIYR
jgi:hypothetical protein